MIADGEKEGDKTLVKDETKKEPIKGKAILCGTHRVT